MKTRTQPEKKRPQFNPTAWMNAHRDFVDWWREHRESGYAENSEGRQRWGMPPWQAYESEACRAEYSGYSEHYTAEEIAAMREEQRQVEAKTAELEVSLGREFWKRVTPAKFISDVKIAVRETLGEEGSMQAKVDKTYEPEPGQSEEETKLLKRRREE